MEVTKKFYFRPDSLCQLLTMHGDISVQRNDGQFRWLTVDCSLDAWNHMKNIVLQIHSPLVFQMLYTENPTVATFAVLICRTKWTVYDARCMM